MNDEHRQNQIPFGKNLEKIRKKRELTRKEMANRLYMTETAFGAYERGVREPNLSKIVEMAKILNVSVEELLTDSPSSFEKNLERYRYDHARMLATAAAFSIQTDYSGEVKLYLPPENDERRKSITFQNQQEFVNAIELAERTALYFNITFVQSFKNQYSEKIS